jgi:hypothetical protein
LVHLVRFYSKLPGMADDLRRSVDQLERARMASEPVAISVRSTGKGLQDWRVRDRLTDQEQRALADAFMAGTAKWKLAERYGVSVSGVKRLLRSMGIRR